MGVLVREYHDDDLESVVHLWDVTAAEQASVFSVAECIAALRADEPAVVAVLEGAVVGAALSSLDNERAWVLRIAVDPTHRGEGIVSSLLVELERLAMDAGARRMAYVLPEEEQLADGLVNAGWRRRAATAYFEKSGGLGPGEQAVIESLGGRVLPGGAWDRIAGMEEEKTLIERRVVLPLQELERAAAHGVKPPRAIALFGPPGTGKTTFARGIASRLGWPFVEIFPSRLAADEGGLANALREVFAQVADLERVLLFIDEVEEIAPMREGVATSPAHGVTNELLKLIPAFRERDTRLLVCATNSVRSLDSAFLRPGRFDYLIPVGPPDEAARRALWARFTEGREDVDLDVLVRATEGFTPADVEYAARVAAQSSFEREVVHGEQPGRPGATTDDYLVAVRQIRPTVTAEIRRDFLEDIARYART
jgi:transitional endoplasmic reticulum ATPase